MDIEWLADVPGAVRLHKDQWMLPQSALRGRVIARLRLQDIITKDRAACGDGRWVRASNEINWFRLLSEHYPWKGTENNHPSGGRFSDRNKPRLRWEPRR